MIISKSRFLQYQSKFYKTLASTPYSIVLLTIRTKNQNDFDNFVGDTDRLPPLEHTFNCLYDKIVNNQQRMKYGVSETVNGIISLSPLQLVPVYGTYMINIKTIKVRFEGRRQVIQKIIYDESIYGSCVGVQLAIEDDIRGGV